VAAENRSRDPFVDKLAFISRAQENVWRMFADTRTTFAIEALQRRSRAYGVEMRFPFLDRRLARFVLSLPVDYWHRNRLWRLQVRPLSDLLPIEVRERNNKATFTPAIINLVQAARGRMAALLAGPHWASEPYVDRVKAKGEFDALRPDLEPAIAWRRWRGVWSIATLEAWLRGVFGYTRRVE
jgi:asparagine synthetase B (glutamine-hydrolysing)